MVGSDVLGGPAAIDNIRAAGLEYLEIPIRTEGFRSRRDDPPLLTTAATLADLRDLEQRLSTAGVQVSSFTCMAGNPLDPANVSVMQRKLDLAAHFGVRFVVADAGAVGVRDGGAGKGRRCTRGVWPQPRRIVYTPRR